MKKKWKIILPVAGILIAAMVLILMFLLREEAYRVIQVSNVDGSASVERVDIGMLDAYSGMMLQSEDAVEVKAESYLYLKLDEDKYVMLEPGSRMQLKASGNPANNKTSIHLSAGAVVNRLDSKLSAESSYEVTTPNSTMAIRGTIFRVEVVPTADGTGVETYISVYEGEVECRLIQPDGTIEDSVVLVGNDQTIIIRNTEDETILVTDPEEVEYEELERRVLEFIAKAIEERTETGMTEETEKLILELLNPKAEPTPEPVECTVTFRYQNEVFAVQIVTSGECVTEPVLKPSMTGVWDYDFTETITQDIIIDWKE